MPTYVYAVIEEDGSLGETFEVRQSISAPPLRTHPQDGRPVRRVPQAPWLPGRGSDTHRNRVLSNGNLDRLGFTKYENAGDGHFEKKAGRGPDVLSADD